MSRKLKLFIQNLPNKPLRILKVNGNSMYPTLKSGAFVLLWQSPFGHKSWYIPIITRYTAIDIGDIVAVKHPQYGDIIKRVSALDYTDVDKDSSKLRYFKKSRQIKRLCLSGDNPFASVSEAAMGWVGADCLIGKVVYIVDK